LRLIASSSQDDYACTCSISNVICAGSILPILFFGFLVQPGHDWFFPKRDIVPSPKPYYAGNSLGPLQP
jgi:hypothetical protein